MTKKHPVVKGDTVSQIAERYGVRVQDIIAANPKLENVNKIRIGQSLNIPAPRKGKNKGSQGPYGRTSQVEINMMRSDGKAYATGVRAKMKAGAETTGTPKKTKTTKDAKSGRSTMLEKAEKLKLQKQGKLPVSKPKAEIAKKKKVAERLKKLAARSANKNGTTMAMPKPKPKPKTQTASRTSRRKGRKA